MFKDHLVKLDHPTNKKIFKPSSLPKRTSAQPSPQRSPSRNNNQERSLERRFSEQEERAPLSRSTTFSSDFTVDDRKGTKWTSNHWKMLEDWYLRKNRDYQKAANAFYYSTSLIDIDLPKQEGNGEPTTKELWPLDQIMRRCQCLDTSFKFHGALPSERKRLKKMKTQP